MRSRLSVALLSLLFAAAPAMAYEGQVQRAEEDAGVHQPQLTRAPELLQFVKAEYPPEATALGIEGSVKLAVTIDAEGNVSDVQVTEPAGHGFDEAAMAAVRQFRFSPAEVDNIPSPVQIEYVYHFVLEAPDAGVAPSADAGTDAPLATATLQGEVISRGSRNRVPAATVRCGTKENAPEATTDERGYFSLEVPAGTCDVKVYANGYQLFQTKEELQPGSKLEVVYHLIPTAIGYETVVRGTREKKEVVRRTVERQEVQRVPGTFGDPVRVIQNFPGVARTPFGLGQLIVRGASPDQTSTMFDGVEIPLLFHLGGGPSVVNPEFLDRVDFYPGGFGARYGRAVGGIVDVGTRRGASDTWHGAVDVSLLNSSVFVEAPVAQNVSVAAAARRSYIDALLPAVLPQDPEGGSLLVLPVYWDYQVRVDVGAKRGETQADGANSFYVMAFGSDDLLKVIATGGARNRDVELDVHTVFHRIKGDWTWRKGKMTSVFAPFLGYDLGGFAYGPEIYMHGNIYNLGGREDFQIDWGDKVTTRAGFDILFQHLVGEGEVPLIGGWQFPPFPGDEPDVELQSISRTVNAFDGALFAELDLKLGMFTFTPGVRGSYARIHGQQRQMAEPRLWVRMEPTQSLAIKGSVGLYAQAPDPMSLEDPSFGNPDLVHEKAFQTSLGFEQKLTDVIKVDVTGYYNRRYDLTVSPGPDVRQPDGRFIRYPYASDGLGRAYGLEVLLKHDITKQFFGWVAYTLNRTELTRTNNPNLDATPGYTIAPYDQTHILTAVGSYRLPGGWEVGARFRYVTGNPTTPITHPYDRYDADANSFSTTRGDRLSARLRPFHQLDVRVDKNFLFESWTLDAYVDVQNAYNAQNVEARYTDYRGRQEYEVPGIPILPIVGVKGSF